MGEFPCNQIKDPIINPHLLPDNSSPFTTQSPRRAKGRGFSLLDVPSIHLATHLWPLITGKLVAIVLCSLDHKLIVASLSQGLPIPVQRSATVRVRAASASAPVQLHQIPPMCAKEGPAGGHKRWHLIAYGIQWYANPILPRERNPNWQLINEFQPLSIVLLRPSTIEGCIAQTINAEIRFSPLLSCSGDYHSGR